MPTADDALSGHREPVVEYRRREALTPHGLAHAPGEIEVELAWRERAVALQRTLQLRRGKLLARHRFERGCERRHAVVADGEPRRERVSAEAQHEARAALRHEIERVAQVEASDGAPRSLELAGGALGEHHGGPMEPILETRGDDADHTLMP